jgi:endoglycosylceramidase
LWYPLDTILNNMLNRVLALGVTALLEPVISRISVNPETRQFVDESGRSVLFHGVNVVYKVAPYIPIQDVFDPAESLSAEDIKNL